MAKVNFYEDPEFLRKQTLFILLGVMLLIVTLFTPLFTLSVGSVQAHLTGMRLDISEILSGLIKIDTGLGWQFYSLMLVFPIGLAAMAGYKKRPLQAKIASAAAVLSLAVLPTAYFYGTHIAEQVAPLKVNVTPNYALAFPLVATGLFIAARARILADERKIKQMNRFW